MRKKNSKLMRKKEEIEETNEGQKETKREMDFCIM